MHIESTPACTCLLFFFIIGHSYELYQIFKGPFSLFCRLVVKGEHMKMFVMSLHRHHCTASPLIVTNGDPLHSRTFNTRVSPSQRAITHEKMTSHVSTFSPSCHSSLFLVIYNHITLSVRTKLHLG